MAVKGSRTITVDPGQDVETDPMFFPVVPSGTYYVKGFLSVSSGGTWYSHFPAGVAGTDYWVSQSASEADLHLSTAAFTATTGTKAFAPFVISHTQPANLPAVVGIGDSIEGGIGESNAFGFFYRAVNGQVPWCRIAVSGSKLQHLIDANVGRRRRRSWPRRCSSAEARRSGGRSLAPCT